MSETSSTAIIRRHTADGESSSTESPGGLAQYHRPAVVQAAIIVSSSHDWTGENAVLVVGYDRRACLVRCPGLFEKGCPSSGDYLLLWPYGKTEWVTAEEFARERAPVEGPVLL